jgi:hypothetical protein
LSEANKQVAQVNEPLADAPTTTAAPASGRTDRASHPRLHLRRSKN